MHIEHELNERLKELKCLYCISELVERHGYDLDSILQGTVNIIPSSWQHPEITCVAITYQDKKYTSSGFQYSPWVQTSAIAINNQIVGNIQVFYLQQMMELDEGPFLREERLLIDAVSERLGRIIERINIRQQLEEDRKTLSAKNIALREIIEQVEYEKIKMKKQVRKNIHALVLPPLLSIENKIANPEIIRQIKLIKENINTITAPSEASFADNEVQLSPVEIQVCNMIRNGFSTKEIAQTRNLSTATIHRHRENIRKKLNITNKKVNLTTYLQKLFTE